MAPVGTCFFVPTTVRGRVLTVSLATIPAGERLLLEAAELQPNQLRAQNLYPSPSVPTVQPAHVVGRWTGDSGCQTTIVACMSQASPQPIPVRYRTPPHMIPYASGRFMLLPFPLVSLSSDTKIALYFLHTIAPLCLQPLSVSHH